MTDDNSIFNQNDNNDDNKPDDNAPPQPQVPAAVAELVGPGKKYATVEKALEALAHAQNHIQTIESENGQLRSKVDGVVSKEELYNTVQELLKAERQTATPATVDEAAIAAMLDRRLTERELQATAKHNTEVVKKAMVDKFADKADEIYKARAQELGLSLGELNAMIGKSPVAALKLLGLDEVKRGTPATTRGTLNTESFNANHNEPKPLPTVMGGATTSQMLDKWRESARKYEN